MGRQRIWDVQFKINWLATWVARLRAVAAASGEDVSAVARRAIEREVERQERKLGIQLEAGKDRRK
jgi:predicted transcriptional regulator